MFLNATQTHDLFILFWLLKCISLKSPPSLVSRRVLVSMIHLDHFKVNVLFVKSWQAWL